MGRTEQKQQHYWFFLIFAVVLGAIVSASVALATTPAKGASVPLQDKGRLQELITVTPSPTATPCTIEFQDVPPGHTFYSFIHCLACYGIVNGYPCGGPGEPCVPPGNLPYFRPGANITRGQLSKIISISAAFDDVIPPNQQTFVDVPVGSTFYIWIEQLAGRGAIVGYPCGGPGEPCPGNYFRPNASTTRGQIAKINTVAAQITDPVGGGQQTFEDVPVGSTFYVWIEQMAGRGIINGYPCGGPGEPCVPPGNRPYFRPGGTATRGQLSKIVANTFYPGCQPFVPCGPTTAELLGDGSMLEGATTTRAGLNVNTATGNFWINMADIGVVASARGQRLQLIRTYNALAANRAGPLGYGWTLNYEMYIDGPTNPTVYLPTGSVALFRGSGPNYLHDARLLAELVRHPEGTYTLTDTRTRWRYLFDTNGKLTQVLSRMNYALTIQRDASQRVQAVTDPGGRTLNFTYDAGGKLIQVQDQAGRSVHYAYDASGNLTQFTNMEGAITHYTYNTTHRLLSLTYPNGGVLTNSYDDQGRVVQQIDPMGREHRFTYLTRGLRTTTTFTDPLGNVTVYTYSCNRLVQLAKSPGTPEQAVWRYTWGASGYPSGFTTFTDPTGATSRAVWNAQGNLITATDPLSRTSVMVYNSANDLLSTTDASGVQTSFTYDVAGNILSTSRPLVGTGQTAVTTIGYDPVHPGDVLTITNTLGKQWHFTYDAQYGYMLTSSNPLGETTHYTYDNLGAVLTVTGPRGYSTQFTYDVYRDPLVISDTLGYATHYTYDVHHNLTSTRDANGYLMTFTYNLEDELTRVTQPDGTHTDYVYDNAGRMVSMVDPLGQITRYTRDSLGNVIQQTDPLSRTTTFRYDAASRLTRLDRPDGTHTDQTYDPAGQLTGVSYSDSTTPNVGYTYDMLGRRLTMTDGTGTTRYTYDSLHRLVQMQNGAGQTVSYGYDLTNNLTALTYPGAGTVTYAYDDAHRMVNLTDWLNNSTQFVYDAGGNLVRQSHANGTRLDVAYDPADRVISMTHSISATTILSATYTRDPVGQITLTHEQAGGQGRADTYAYDMLNRLTSDLAEAPGATLTRTWGYDAAFRLTQTGLQPQATPPTNDNRTYDPASELFSLIEQQGTAQTKNYSYLFSPTGNRTRRTDNLGGPTINYTYDQEDRLKDYNSVAQHAYNGDGLRMSKTVGAVTQQFTWDVGKGLPMLLQDGSARYIYGPGMTLLEEVTNGGQVYYYHTDQLGSVRTLTDGAGQVANRYTYEPYGMVISSTVTVTNPFGFAGEYTDAESGLIYLRARYYDPPTQQFLTVDPLLSLTERAYAYVGDNPLNYTDPTGLAETAKCKKKRWKGKQPIGM
ncbi:MAG: RHS repeat-associated core domain-containing protein [Chloroflexia bacterium]